MTFSTLKINWALIDSKHISDNQEFDWSSESPSSFLESSLKQHGILEPLIVVSCQNSEKIQIIDGFKRIRAMRTLFPELIPQKYPCLILSSSCSTVDLGELRLSMFTALDTLKGVEVCRVLLHLKELGFSEQRLADEVLPKLKLKASLHRVKQFLDLGRQFKMQNFSSDFALLGAEDLLPLLKFSKQDFIYCIKLRPYFSVGGKKWKMLLQLLHEVCRLKECTLEELLAMQEVKSILENPQLQAPVRYRSLKQQLEHWRYPEWTLLRDTFEKHLQKMQLPHGVQLHADSTFEQEYIHISLKAISPESLKEQWKALWTQEREIALQELFQIQQGLQK